MHALWLKHCGLSREEKKQKGEGSPGCAWGGPNNLRFVQYTVSFWFHLGATEDALMAYRWTKYRVDAGIDKW